MKSRARRRHKLDAQLLQVVVAGELYRQVAGETVWALNEDGPDTVAGDAGQHGLEPMTLRHRIAPLTAAS